MSRSTERKIADSEQNFNGCWDHALQMQQIYQFFEPRFLVFANFEVVEFNSTLFKNWFVFYFHGRNVLLKHNLIQGKSEIIRGFGFVNFIFVVDGFKHKQEP